MSTNKRLKNEAVRAKEVIEAVADGEDVPFLRQVATDCVTV